MVFPVETEQAVKRLQTFAFCVVNVNSTVVFEHLIILNILKDKFLSSWALFILKLYKVFQTALRK